MIKRSPLCYFKTSPEVIRLAVMLYVRFPLALRNVEDLLHERGHCQRNPYRPSFAYLEPRCGLVVQQRDQRRLAQRQEECPRTR